ncbi:MAG: hypothetical protein K2X82_17680 [Gemmataceae bacterium]|nr:hypothetical protein [Gemmataceae bacterium]
MGWECRGNRTYYYHGRRDGRRVVKEYVGAGPAADLIARYDALDRDRRAAEADTTRQTIADLDALTAAVAPLDEAADLVARAALLAAGFRRHHRGPWRKRRARPAEDTPPDPATG